ncbi:MAG: response regulator [Caulobacter sp.]
MTSRPKMLPSTKVNLEKLDVMLVDDNSQALDILAQVVSGFGVRSIVRCASGDEAKTKLLKGAYDLVLTDAQMPGLDGYELASWLRHSGPDQNRFVPVLLITAHTRHSDVARARDCGANYLIAKPVTPKTVLERIYWVAREDRMFVESDTYAGPDRRFRREGPPPGMTGRRSGDLSAAVGHAETPNLSQDEIDSLMKPTKVSI